MPESLLIYGSYGYTGELIVQRAMELGLRPILAGRSAEKVSQQAARHGLEHRAFALERPEDVAGGLAGCKAVIHCAGPFSRTAKAMAAGCMKAGTHYLDITGEIEVFEAMAALGREAEAAGVMLMPGTGFDVVPSDCLAAHMKSRLPGAQTLLLAFHSAGRTSHGTALTMAENIHKGGMIRKGGALTSVPGAYRIREIDFGDAHRVAMTIPWGDVSTAFYSTGIPNIEVYMAAPLGLRLASSASRYIGGLLGSAPVQQFIQGRIPAGGPSPEERARGYCLLWAEATDAAGTSVRARLKTPEGYTLTAMTAVGIAQKVLAGNFKTGFQTPGMAYGKDLILEFGNCVRTDE
ncbi:MAG: saccharopine dehydrogenase NADP-binding domain-containing protein [Candidatus Hydrogenedentes bacterium]|nr:saccharopine dehydrogenase NADP-binding domain-containing protein [Candidatus Hydrogenedentota bacterium]